MKVNGKDDIPYIMENKTCIKMFETTNQFIFITSPNYFDIISNRYLKFKWSVKLQSPILEDINWSDFSDFRPKSPKSLPKRSASGHIAQDWDEFAFPSRLPGAPLVASKKKRTAEGWKPNGGLFLG